jgi:hypothetical protein
MAEEFQAALFVYDEGLLGGDRKVPARTDVLTVGLRQVNQSHGILRGNLGAF